VVASYLFALHDLDLPVNQARTVATTVLVLVGLFLVMALERGGWRRGVAVGGLCLGLLAAYAVALLTPPIRRFFELHPPSADILLTALAGALVSIVALHLAGFSPFARAGSAPPGDSADQESSTIA
jgi:hypothetical protein